jgi:hypothetical protein
MANLIKADLPAPGYPATITTFGDKEAEVPASKSRSKTEKTISCFLSESL